MNTNFDFHFKWLAVTSFEMRFGNTTVVTDPYIGHCKGTDLTVDAVEHCDIICVSHTHWDHITDIPALVEKFRPKLLCGDQSATPLARWLNYSPSRIYPMYPDTELDFGDVKIRALYGRHSEAERGFNDQVALTASRDVCQADPGIAELQGVGSMEYRNFLFTAPNGTKILLWGSDPTVEQLNLCKALQPHIAIIQRTPDYGEILEKADFAAQLGCKVVIPHHHDFRGVDDPTAVNTLGSEFLRRVPDGIFIAPKHGEWIHL